MPLLDLFWTMLWFFLFFAWIWLLIMVIADIFRSHDMGGWAKALWVLFIIFVPWLGVLVYLIARGQSMGERHMQDAIDREKATRSYIQQAAGTTSSTAEELTKLADLKNSGVITEEEFAAQKAKLLAS
jgi:hypothetical protein